MTGAAGREPTCAAPARQASWLLEQHGARSQAQPHLMRCCPPVSGQASRPRRLKAPAAQSGLARAAASALTCPRQDRTSPPKAPALSPLNAPAAPSRPRADPGRARPDHDRVGAAQRDRGRAGRLPDLPRAQGQPVAGRPDPRSPSTRARHFPLRVQVFARGVEPAPRSRSGSPRCRSAARPRPTSRSPRRRGPRSRRSACPPGRCRARSAARPALRAGRLPGVTVTRRPRAGRVTTRGQNAAAGRVIRARAGCRSWSWRRPRRTRQPVRESLSRRRLSRDRRRGRPAPRVAPARARPASRSPAPVQGPSSSLMARPRSAGPCSSRAPWTPWAAARGRGPLLDAATPVHGAWGSGRLLRTSLLDVLITSKGAVLAGAVSPPCSTPTPPLK